ncbi:MAG: thiamine pyrophosphate-binding protein [Haloferacaceae archaeon]
MTWETPVVDALRRREVDVVAYLPDSVLDGLVGRIEDDDAFEAVRVAREEEAVGLLSGAWLSGRRGALVCQSSGLANTFNALGSHAKADGLPFVGIVSARGGLGDHNLAQVPAGYPMPRLLDDLSVRNRTLDPADDVEHCVDLAAKTAFSTEDPYVLLLDQTLTGTKPGR